MLFKDYHIYPMFLGVKTYTRRLWASPHVKIGKEYPVTHKLIYKPEEIVGYIVVEELYKQPLRMMTEEEAHKEGAYTVEVYRKVLCDIAKDSWENLQYSVPYVVKFRFHLSDMVDEPTLRNDYYMKWKNHMIKYGLNIWRHE